MTMLSVPKLQQCMCAVHWQCWTLQGCCSRLSWISWRCAGRHYVVGRSDDPVHGSSVAVFSFLIWWENGKRFCCVTQKSCVLKVIMNCINASKNMEEEIISHLCHVHVSHCLSDVAPSFECQTDKIRNIQRFVQNFMSLENKRHKKNLMSSNKCVYLFMKLQCPEQQ